MPNNTPEQAQKMREARARKIAARKAAAAGADSGTNRTEVGSGDAAPAKANRYAEWRNGGEGCIQWIEEHVWIDVAAGASEIKAWHPVGNLPDEPNPLTGRSPRSAWEEHKKTIREALVVENGKFKHKFIFLCWPRGEAKTYINAYILMWKFFCWPEQNLVLCANSKDQSKMVQFGIVKKLIQNSPKLIKLVGRKNIQEKQIRIRDKDSKTVSTIQSVSSYTGVLSGITGFSFSEIFLLTDQEFWNQISGSIRITPNALGLIDSTVSAKTHILYKMYLKSQDERNKESGTIYFSYRYSESGDYRDYINPHYSQKEIDLFRDTQVLGGFERFFLNLWSHGARRVFEEDQVAAVAYLGAECSYRNHARVIELLDQRRRLVDEEKRLGNVGNNSRVIADIDSRLAPVSSVYKLSTASGLPMLASADALSRLGDTLDTDWSVLVGLDRADPMKYMDSLEGEAPADQERENDRVVDITKRKRQRSAARTILVAVAKGLPGSRSNPSLGALSEPQVTLGPDGTPLLTSVSFVYFLVHLADIEDHSMVRIKAEVAQLHNEYDGIDKFTAEKYAAADVTSWAADELNLTVETVSPGYPQQLAAFTELYTIIRSGRFKAPEVYVPGSRGGDILREEMSMFDHDSDKKWFGSPEKNSRYGVQDDVMYSIAWSIYGGRALSVKDFRARGRQPFWGAMMHPKGLVGKW